MLPKLRIRGREEMIEECMAFPFGIAIVLGAVRDDDSVQLEENEAGAS